MFYLYGCNIPNKEKNTEKRLDEKSTQEMSEESDEKITQEMSKEPETNIKETKNERLFDSFIGKDKEYVEKNANWFTEKKGHYIIYMSDTEETNDSVEVIFNEKNEAEFFVWKYEKTLDPLESTDYLEATLLGPKRLGLSDKHRIQKTGNLISNYMATIYDDDIMGNDITFSRQSRHILLCRKK